MIINFPWSSFNDIKFNDGEILNHATINSHIKKIYDNGIALNRDPRIAYASTTGYGLTYLAPSAEVITGLINDKCITTNTLSSVIDDIEVSTASFSASSSINITDNLICMHGEFTTYTGLSAPYVYKLYYNNGNAVFNNAPLLFTVSPICSSAPLSTDNINCYRYVGQNDTTDFNILSSQVTDYTDYSRHSHIVYYNKDNKIQSIKWCAIGDKNTSTNFSGTIDPVTFKFTGVIDGSFNKYNNFFPPGIPTPIDNVILDNTRTTNPSSGTLNCGYMTLNDPLSTGTVHISGGTINSIIEFNNICTNSLSISSAVFNDTATNAGSAIYGVFNDNSINTGYVYTGIFNDSSTNAGSAIYGVFND